jgi:DNA-binding transcriptional LysR family regulator
MNLSDLEVLVHVAEDGSFTRAAERLNRTQPGVSQAIRRLEEAYDVRLLARNTQRTVLTDSGTLLVSCAERILKIMKEARQALSVDQTNMDGVLRLAANSLMCQYFLPPLLEAFRQVCPWAKIDVTQCPASTIPQAMAGFDFGFITFEPLHPNLESKVLFHDDLVLALPPHHRLAAFPVVAFTQLAGERFLVHSSMTPTRKRVEDRFIQSGVSQRGITELPNVTTIKQFIAAGEGIAILPKLCLAKELAEGSIVSPGLEGPPVRREIRVAYRRSGKPSRPGAAFQHLLLNGCDKLHS